MNAEEYLKKSSEEIDPAIRSYIEDEEPMRLIDASRQYPYAGGKRMRPAMVMAACGAVGGNKKDAVPLAVAVEYIHNFTLIHDDVMDGDDRRRGMLTIHVAYDEPTAILAGDALFAKAFQIIAEMDVPDKTMRLALKYVTKAVWDLARGQEYDVTNEGKLITEAQYLETVRLKTSVLFAAAACGGAAVGGADDKQLKALEGYADALGMGFQMYDDYLGVAGDTAKTGKSVGNDIRKGKCTLMVTYTLENLEDKKVLEEFKGILGNPNASEEAVRRAEEIMESVGAVEYNRRRAVEEIAKAKSCITCFKNSDEKEFMIALADFAIDRDV